MKWDYWTALYTGTHCTARGLRPATIAAYQKILEQFRRYVRQRHGDAAPDALGARELLGYVEHLRTERRNGDAAVNRQVVVLRGFYRALVAMGQLEPARNPLAHFPRLKAPSRKLPAVLGERELGRLLDAPEADTVIGLRDRALLRLLYGTGIRASECAGLREADVDLDERTIRVVGKGGHERTLPLNDTVARALHDYRQQRGPTGATAAFFMSRLRRGITRTLVYERVRSWARRARLVRAISPHGLRHTFATHLVRAGVGIVTIRDLLGHRQITSTERYLHVTAQELREAAERHPIARLVDTVAALLPDGRLPLQRVPPPFRPRYG